MSAWRSGMLASNHGCDSSGLRRAAAGAALTSEPMPPGLATRPNPAATPPPAAIFNRFLRLIFVIGVLRSTWLTRFRQVVGLVNVHAFPWRAAEGARNGRAAPVAHRRLS